MAVGKKSIPLLLLQDRIDRINHVSYKIIDDNFQFIHSSIHPLKMLVFSDKKTGDEMFTDAYKQWVYAYSIMRAPLTTSPQYGTSRCCMGGGLRFNRHQRRGC